MLLRRGTAGFAGGRDGDDDLRVAEKMERAMGFEPTTSTLARLRSTPELRPHNAPRNGAPIIAPGRAFSRPLLKTSGAGSHLGAGVLDAGKPISTGGRSVSKKNSLGRAGNPDPTAERPSMVVSSIGKPKTSMTVGIRRHLAKQRQDCWKIRANGLPNDGKIDTEIFMR